VWYAVKKIFVAISQPKKFPKQAPTPHHPKRSETLFPPTEIKDAEFKEIH